jgi:hypothetical protein
MKRITFVALLPVANKHKDLRHARGHAVTHDFDL